MNDKKNRIKEWYMDDEKKKMGREDRNLELKNTTQSHLLPGNNVISTHYNIILKKI